MRTPLPHDVDLRVESFEEMGRTGVPLPDRLYGGESKADSCGDPGQTFPMPLRSRPCQHHQGGAGARSSAIETKPGLCRREHAPPLALHAHLTLPASAMQSHRFDTRSIEKHKGEPTGRKKDLGRGEGCRRIGRAHPEHSWKNDAGRLCTLGIEGVGEIDPGGKVPSAGHLGKEFLGEARNADRTDTDHLRESSPG